MILFLKGLLLGLAIAAPVGPIGVLCIQRTLKKGRLTGFISGLGAATADGIYGSIAAFGLTWLTQFLIAQKFWLGLCGGIFLCYLGIQILRKPMLKLETTSSNSDLWAAYLSTLILTLTNPATILSFIAIFAGLGLVTTAASYTSALLLTAGVFLGSALWWLLLSAGVGWLQRHHGSDRITASRLRWIDYLSGIIIIAFGCIALWSLV
jgi:threonine/homoserine/homoserine lactone efflux protein